MDPESTSKLQRMMNPPDEINQSSNAAILKNTFTGMTAQSAYVQATSSYYINKNVESLSSRVDDHPFRHSGEV